MEEEEVDRVQITPAIRRCVEAASDCYTVCTETLTHSLDDGGDLSEPRHIRLLIDCGEISQTTQNVLLRGSELTLMLVAVCAEACEKAAESCRQLDGSDEQLELCAETCMRCADSCRELVL
ncbi:MAG TPA: four-helix bundle copper-binding protein [Gaiellaceae bacterium]|nr:four-helix bundle copper-binding protein [Gaiellaceae bacterium]